ncbi:hypothetical protein AB0B94_30980 [Micromonospora sp. NPDC048986]|uniref:hypothetical protein n=1 Tax=Micromonospora sp. NPDC048986 TaxID=3155644 RepID=UPI0033CC5D46
MDQLTNTKTQHPADGSRRWIVAGLAGSIVFDTLGNHLAILDPAGNVTDSMCKRYANEARNISEYYDDNTVFQLLADHYRNHLTGGERRASRASAARSPTKR